MIHLYEYMHESASFLKQEGMGTADLGIILGSGLDEVHAMMEDQMSLEYASIPHMTGTTAPGHTGMLRFGRIGEKQVLVFCGRFHYYEGHPMWRVVYPVRIIQALGVPRILVTAAAGGLNDTYTTGDLVLVNDHINLMPDNPLRGLSDPRLGDRFRDMTDGYDKEWRHQIMSIAADLGITLKTGIYAGLQGPNLETQAECDFLRRVGADLLSVGGKPRQSMRAKEHAHGTIGILMHPHHGLDEVGPEPAFRQLQPPTAPCDGIVVGDGSLFDHAQRLAPSLVPVGNERRAFLLGLDRKRRVMLGDVMRFQPRVGGLDRPDSGEPQVLRQPALQRAEHPLGAPARLRRICCDMLDPKMR